METTVDMHVKRTSGGAGSDALSAFIDYADENGIADSRRTGEREEASRILHISDGSVVPPSNTHLATPSEDDCFLTPVEHFSSKKKKSSSSCSSISEDGSENEDDCEEHSVSVEDEIPSRQTNGVVETVSATEKLVRAISQPSTKIRVLLEILAETNKRSRDEKTLVFSQWKTMLNIVEYHIEGEGYETCRLDGSMPIKKRKAEIKEFKVNGRKKVFLISLHAGGVGLNLTAASNVILLDVWWNPATEEQAIDRVHRIGQKRTVRVYRFKIEKSVEEKIYDMCARKKELAEGMLGAEGKQTLGRQKISMEDIMELFGGAAKDIEEDAGEVNSEVAEAAKNVLRYTKGVL